jgi:hypothetical protein
MKAWAKLLDSISCDGFSSIVCASTLYSNIGAGFPADSASSYSTGANFLGTTFTTTAAGILGSIEIDVDGTGPVTVGLYTSSSNEPGTLLESWSAVIPAGAGFPVPAVTILTSVVPVSLSASTQYWFVFAQSSGNQVHWFSNDESVSGGSWVSSAGQTLTSLINEFSSSPAPGIQLIAAPEPASAILLGLGFGGLLLTKRTLRRRA